MVFLPKHDRDSEGLLADDRPIVRIRVCAAYATRRIVGPTPLQGPGWRQEAGLRPTARSGSGRRGRAGPVTAKDDPASHVARGNPGPGIRTSACGFRKDARKNNPTPSSALTPRRIWSVGPCSGESFTLRLHVTTRPRDSSIARQPPDNRQTIAIPITNYNHVQATCGNQHIEHWPAPSQSQIAGQEC